MTLSAAVVLAKFGDIEQDLNVVIVDEVLSETNQPLPTLSQYDEVADAVMVSTGPLFHFARSTSLSPLEAATIVVAFQTHRSLNAEQETNPSSVDSMSIAVNVLKTILPSKSGQIRLGPQSYSFDDAII
jgi:hypothetical protein